MLKVVTDQVDQGLSQPCDLRRQFVPLRPLQRDKQEYQGTGTEKEFLHCNFIFPNIDNRVSRLQKSCLVLKIEHQRAMMQIFILLPNMVMFTQESSSLVYSRFLRQVDSQPIKNTVLDHIFMQQLQSIPTKGFSHANTHVDRPWKKSKDIQICCSRLRHM